VSHRGGVQTTPTIGQFGPFEKIFLIDYDEEKIEKFNYLSFS